MNIKNLLQKNQLLFDGAMGTMMQKNGLPIGAQPEYFNISHPDIVEKIHREYVQAGADIITANTFQASTLKLKDEQEVTSIITAAIQLAKRAGAPFVALDIGPLGQLLEPMGTLSFDNAYELFKQQVIAGEKAGADCILFETFSDLMEAKLAILAAKENTSLPVICTMTYQEDGRTFVGTDPMTATLTLQALGIDAVGANCSLGPKELAPIIDDILKYAKIPVIVQANAGLPQMVNGETVYLIKPKEYAQSAQVMLQKGVQILGGCCGTTPTFIQELRQVIEQEPVITPKPKIVTAICSNSMSVVLDNNLSIIGERINPTGKKKLKEALRKEDFSYILSQGISQQEDGADILDVNVGLPELDEADMMDKVVRRLQSVVQLPLQIDSSDVKAIERGARVYCGRPLINSVNGKKESLETILPIVKKYGGLVLGLALDENGIPDTAQKRLEIAEYILQTALEYGIAKEDVLIDPLVLTASAQQDQVMVTIDTLRLIKEKLGLKTVMGLSNVSFGLPNRELLNATFLAMASGAGLDAPILNPGSARCIQAVKAIRVFKGQDKDSTQFIEYAQNIEEISTISTKNATNISKNNASDLKTLILQGQKEQAIEKTKELLETLTPLDIVNKYFIPALDEVGTNFEKGTLFLPQLMQSAEAVQAAQNVLKEALEKEGKVEESQGRILLATVQGDIHDIGKNIVHMLLDNYGFDVLDLGKDVPIDTLVETIKKENIQLVGLSALMTTTVQNMKKSIQACKDAGLNCTFMVGGAVLNEEYKDFVGADYYAKDAMQSVTIAQEFYKK